MFEPRVAVASLSGQSDASWARHAAPYVGCAFLGGIAIDRRTRQAAREMVARDRCEFLPPDPIAFIDRQLTSLDPIAIRPAVNIRSVTTQSVQAIAGVCTAHGAIIEINAHCRQEEMCQVGAGEALLHDHDRLTDYVRTAEETGATVSVKVRAELPGVDLPTLARRLADAGADIIHVDAMDSEPVVGQIAAATPDLFLLANNGVRDAATAHEYFQYGADAVSIGRPSDDPDTLRRVHQAVTEWDRIDAVDTPMEGHPDA